MRSQTSEYAGKMRHRLLQAGIGTEITTRSSNELQYKQRTAASLVVRSKRPQRFFGKVLPGKRPLTIETNTRQNCYKIRENTNLLHLRVRSQCFHEFSRTRKHIQTRDHIYPSMHCMHAMRPIFTPTFGISYINKIGICRREASPSLRSR